MGRIVLLGVATVSHIVTIQTKIHDPVAIAAACVRLQLQAPAMGSVQLYSGEASGVVVQLPDWQYPLVIETLTGAIRYDNFEGHWGDPAHLDRFLQMYAVEKAKLEARKKGYAVNEQTLQDGSIKLQIIARA